MTMEELSSISTITAKTLALHWHEGGAAIYSLCTQPDSSCQSQNGQHLERLVTGGGDNNARVWNIVRNEIGEVTGVEYLSTITKHTQAVNCVRFNNTGDLLATASDDGSIMIWEKNEQIVRDFGVDVEDDIKESWSTKIVCYSSNMSEIYDISWSPDSKYICCGLMDNVIRIFNISTGALVQQIAEHNHYVQGVTWDPLGEFICSQSADRSVHFYQVSYNDDSALTIGPNAMYKSIKSEVVASTTHESLSDEIIQTPANMNTESTIGTPLKVGSNTLSATNQRQQHLYHNETLPSFFRRLTFSPDGALLVSTSGIHKNEQGQERNTVWVYTRAGIMNHRGPIAHLPGLRKPAIAVRFSPIKYKLREDIEPVFAFPYRLIFAVVTQDSIVLYDTQSKGAIAIVTGLHYANLTDVAWASSGKTLFISSVDGFVSTVNLGDSIATLYT
ncbi:hypothetical protein CANINC_002148 [Pichia inconspicua]|uniref:CAF1B/HIR1 beta-propeller domain-containing protein n=1 Tax=Pichia inconspicua TaxID=52247 RepID=A0A4T0X1S7_9ASCO|nr:hypothetical protein CANINC_002148 [[Candida] inconspicua]